MRKIHPKLFTSTYEGFIVSPLRSGNLCFPTNHVSNQRRAFHNNIIVLSILLKLMTSFGLWLLVNVDSDDFSLNKIAVQSIKTAVANFTLG